MNYKYIKENIVHHQPEIIVPVQNFQYRMNSQLFLPEYFVISKFIHTSFVHCSIAFNSVSDVKGTSLSVLT